MFIQGEGASANFECSHPEEKECVFMCVCGVMERTKNKVRGFEV